MTSVRSFTKENVDKKDVLKLQDKTLKKVIDINRTLDTTVDIGVRTLEELRDQSSQIDDIDDNLQGVQVKQVTTSNLINKFSVWSKPVSYVFGLHKKLTVDSSNTNYTNVSITENNKKVNSRKVIPESRSKLVYNPNNDDFLDQVNSNDDEINRELDRTSDFLDVLDCMVTDMGSELKSQNKKIDSVDSKMSRTLNNQSTINNSLTKHL